MGMLRSQNASVTTERIEPALYRTAFRFGAAFRKASSIFGPPQPLKRTSMGPRIEGSAATVRLVCGGA